MLDICGLLAADCAQIGWVLLRIHGIEETGGWYGEDSTCESEEREDDSGLHVGYWY